MTFCYNLMAATKKSSTSVKNLNIKVLQNLKFTQQCNEATKKANSMLQFINRSFTLKSQAIILLLHKSLVRPHLEYAVGTPAYK